MYFRACRSYKEDDSQNHFVCSNYKSNTGSCKIHFIGEQTLKEQILRCIQRTLTYVQLFREDFQRELLQQDTAARKAELAGQRRTLADAQKRIADLDTLVQKVYEDNALGKLPDARYLKLSAQYEQEQQEIAQLAAKLEREIETETAQMVDMDKFIVLADRYANLTELTAPIVNELISKIVVHSPEKRYSRKHVTIEVFFTYVGKIRIPINSANTDDEDIA